MDPPPVKGNNLKFVVLKIGTPLILNVSRNVWQGKLLVSHKFSFQSFHNQNFQPQNENGQGIITKIK